MDDTANLKPAILDQLEAATKRIGFKLASEPLTGSLLRTLATTKPAGRFFEIGTGTGIATAWLLDGMDRASTLTSVENDEKFLVVARQHLSGDPKVTFHHEDAADLIARLPKASLDLIFADTWAGKYTHLDETLQLLKPGGFYVVDDMLPQLTWPEGHAPKVERLILEVEARRDLVLTKMGWGSGVVVAAKTPQPR